MPEGWEATTIPGVQRRSLARHADERGAFTELWRASWTDGLEARFVQANLSQSAPGVLRGMHFHDRQADLWIVLSGRAFVALTDLRGLIAEHGGEAAEASSETLALPAGSALFIPRGVAHGFLALEELTLAYLVSAEYDGTDEHGFSWDDPAAQIAWPGVSPVLSDRDRSNPRLDEAVAAARQRGEHNAGT
jgi:dTDP-4-dehydrorhamnose 3,5-epimerase